MKYRISNRTRSFWIQCVSLMLVFLWIYTASQKLFYRNAFYDVLQSSVLIHHFAWLLSWCIPLSELTAAGLLLFDKTKFAGLILSSLLLTLFTLYIIWMLLSDMKLPCSCGGFINHLSWPQHLVLNILLLIITFYGMQLQRIEMLDNIIHVDQNSLRKPRLQ